MTPQQNEALKLALEALEGFYEYGYDRQECFEHITAIKEALAEHAMQEVQRLGQEIEQEPVGMVKDLFTYTAWEKLDLRGSTKVYLDTPPQRTEQEPVAYLCENAVGHKYFRWKKPSNTYKPIPLYTTPPQRTWVNLTDEDRNDCLVEADPCECLATPEAQELMRCVEAKLRSKNK